MSFLTHYTSMPCSHICRFLHLCLFCCKYVVAFTFVVHSYIRETNTCSLIRRWTSTHFSKTCHLEFRITNNQSTFSFFTNTCGTIDAIDYKCTLPIFRLLQVFHLIPSSSLNVPSSHSHNLSKLFISVIHLSNNFTIHFDYTK